MTDSARTLPLSAVVGGGAALLIALVTTAILALQTLGSFQITRELVGEKALLVIDSVESAIDRHLAPSRESLTWMARLYKDGFIDISSREAITSALVSAPSAVRQNSTFAFVDSNFQAVQMFRDNNSIEFRDLDWSANRNITGLFDTRIPETSGIESRIVYVEELQAAVIGMATRIGPKASRAGAFVTSVDTQSLSAVLARLQQRHSAVPFILRNHTEVVAFPTLVNGYPAGSPKKPLPEIAEISSEAMQLFASDRRELLEIRQETSAWRVASETGTDYIFVAREIELFPGHVWTVGCYFLADTIGAEFQNLRKLAAIGIGLIILASLLGLWVARRLARPVLQLTDAAEAVSLAGPNAVQPLRGSWLRELDNASSAFNEMISDLRDRQRTREIFGRFVPGEIVKDLVDNGKSLECEQRITTTLFTDIAGFSTMAENMDPEDLMSLLNEYFELIAPCIEAFGGVIHQFQGDAVLATYNLPIPDDAHADNALRSAALIQQETSRRRFGSSDTELRTRIGINTGKAICGLVGGGARLGFTVHGDHVNLASRLESMNKAEGTSALCSGSTRDASSIGERLTFVRQAAVTGRFSNVDLYTFSPDDVLDAEIIARYEAHIGNKNLGNKNRN